MHELYKLKDKLCEELEEYGSKELNASSLEIVDKLSHALKNIDKIIKCKEEEGYSGGYDGGYDGARSYGYDGRSYTDSFDGMSNAGYRYSTTDPSYARGRGAGARRDSMGRYSRSGMDMAKELRQMMNEAPDERTKEEIRKLVNKMEQM